MGEKINKLLSISSNPFNQGRVNIAPDLLLIAGKLGQELNKMLMSKNGFFAFESALRVFPSTATKDSYGLTEWNSPAFWRADYAGLADDCFFFAEDIFGGQFCINENSIHSFDPETGDLEEIAQDFEGWAEEILANYNVLTGCSLAHVWQEKYGALPSNQRLMPKIPFVCGGQFEIDNLLSINALSGMRSRANLARQIVDMPEGAKIEFNIIE